MRESKKSENSSFPVGSRAGAVVPSIYSSARTELAKLLIYGLFRKIRVLAQDGIVGITPRKLDNHLAYAMRVDESLTFEEYWSDRRFRSKRPRWRKGAPIVDKCGDNCYAPIGDGDFRQLRSQHWDHKNDREDKRGMPTTSTASVSWSRTVLLLRRRCCAVSRARRLSTARSVQPRELH